MTTKALLRVGFIGLGAMGGPMTRRLVEAGYEVKGFDLDDQARHRAELSGVAPVEQIEAAAAGIDILVLMLPDSNAVESVLTNELLISALSPNVAVVDMSSSEPLRTRSMAKLLSDHGVTLIDAPVSGGVAGAANGKLTVMAGGDVDVVGNLTPFLETFGKVLYAGPVGSGHAVKALNNLLSATHLLITSEAMATGERFGLDPELMLAIFNESSGRSASTQNKWPNFISTGSFDSGFGIGLMLKDMKIAIGLATEVNVPCELGQESVSVWSDAADQLGSKADHTQIARWLYDR
jgi:3-hydroxyisobutyrate dehydrogenase